jgi:outer membrane usher protein
VLLRPHNRKRGLTGWLGGVGILFLILATMPRSAAVGVVAEPSPETAPDAAPSLDPAASAASAASAPASNGDETLLLEVRVNGSSIGKIGEFTLRYGRLMARAAELRDLGFRVPASAAAGRGDLIALSDLPGLNWTVDRRNLVLYVTINDTGLLPTLVQPNLLRPAEDHRVIQSGTGATLNYDIVNTLAGSHYGATGSFDLRAFSPRGVTSSDWLAYAGANSASSGTNKAIRLDSAYTFSDVNSLRRYSVGDYITSGLSWTRPVHLEGIQIRSDFSMRPDLVTFPMPMVTGSAAVPSTLNVLTDGNLMVSSQIGAGPFEIPQLPVISGAGAITMTVTNAMGQQVTISQPFYASTALLAPGLQTFAGQAGLVRRNWGAVSDDYGKIAGAALYRRGLTRDFTIEGSAEGTPGALLAGAGGAAQIANLGVLNFSAAASGGPGNVGAQFSLGAQRIGRTFSLGASAIVANRDYRDVASMNGDGVERKQLSAFASLFFRRYGSIGLAYGGADQDAAPVAIPGGGSVATHSHVLSASYSLSLHHVSIYATEFKDFANPAASNGVQVGLTIPFGRRASISASVASDVNAQVQLQQSAPQIGDSGYQVYVSGGDSNHEFAEFQYKSPVGLFTAGVDSTDGQTTLRMESQAALSIVDGGVFPSNTIYDSFAIVDTNPIPYVHVLQENRDVGTTNSSGRLLVPDMRSFDLNQISIQATDIPPDVTLKDASIEMRPQDRSGVVVKFPVDLSLAALLKLVDETGAPIPLGSSATLQATGVASPIGYDGEAYVENLCPHNTLIVERNDGRRCAITFEYRPVPGEIPKIGPLPCLERKP